MCHYFFLFFKAISDPINLQFAANTLICASYPVKIEPDDMQLYHPMASTTATVALNDENVMIQNGVDVSTTEGNNATDPDATESDDDDDNACIKKQKPNVNDKKKKKNRSDDSTIKFVIIDPNIRSHSRKNRPDRFKPVIVNAQDGRQRKCWVLHDQFKKKRKFDKIRSRTPRKNNPDYIATKKLCKSGFERIVYINKNSNPVKKKENDDSTGNISNQQLENNNVTAIPMPTSSQTSQFAPSSVILGQIV